MARIFAIMKWKVAPMPEKAVIHQLAAELNGVSPELATLLYIRGIRDLETAKAFFYPDQVPLHDPFLMADMDKAATRLSRLIASREPVFLLGDYDVDGTTSVSMLTLIFEALQVPVQYHIPDRYKEGYGVSYVGIDAAVASGAKVLITLDCGIRSVEHIRYATQRGLEVIICDHHEPGEELPPALAVLDPKRPDCPYPFKELTGCGVGYKLMQACFQLLQEDTTKLDSALDLLALSIACDIVPIVGENRTFVYRGLQKLTQNPVPGLRAMMNLSDRKRSWNVSDLVFFLGPRINAAGRITHARHAVDVLTGKVGNLDQLAIKLEEDNALRKELDENHTRQALALIASDATYAEKKTTVLFHPEWHKGVVGIVASRLIEKHYRPTVLLARAEGKWVGSARSVAGFDLHSALEACRDHLLQFGGHKYAAGMTIAEDRLTEFAREFDAVVTQRIAEDQLYPTLFVDQVLPIQSLTRPFVKTVAKMGPFGPGNLQPVFAVAPAEATDIRILKDEHLKFKLVQGNQYIDAIAFGMVDKLPILESGLVAVAGHADLNVFRDQESVQMLVKDIVAWEEGIS